MNFVTIDEWVTNYIYIYGCLCMCAQCTCGHILSCEFIIIRGVARESYVMHNKLMFYHPKPGAMLQVKPVNLLPLNIL